MNLFPTPITPPAGTTPSGPVPIWIPGLPHPIGDTFTPNQLRRNWFPVTPPKKEQR